MISRRDVLRASAAGLILPGTAVFAQQDQRPAALSADLVKEFVGVSHGNFDRVKELLDANPTLLNAAWDWGGGDFELAIAAAGHVGSREIVELLISRGATTTLFVHAMMGDFAIVKAMLDRNPNLIDSKGPHGITLERHAEKGGEKAKEVLDYLKTLKKLI